MVKIAVIGAGFMGRTHAEAYSRIELAQVAAVCDRDKALGEKFAEDFGCSFYEDFDTMAAECEFEVADICLPTFLHETFTVKAAEHGKHIFCEKPATLSVESLDRMIGAAEKAGVNLMIGQVVRFWPEYRTAKQMRDNGELGELNYAYGARLSEHPAWSEWYRRPENSGGGLFDLHLHDIDFFCWMFGEVESVFASGKKNELGCWNFVNSTLNFQSGQSASVQGVIEMTKGYPFTMELRLTGSKATYEYIMKAGANLEDVASARRDTRVYGQDGARILPLDETDAYETELRHFVACISEHRESEIIPAASARKVMCVMEALKTSLETGKQAAVDYGKRQLLV